MKDTNGDGVKNESDKLSLAVSTPSGEDYKVILQQFDRVIGKSLSEEDMVVVIYQTEGIAYSMLLNLVSLKVIHTNELPKVKNS